MGVRVGWSLRPPPSDLGLGFPREYFIHYAGVGRTHGPDSSRVSRQMSLAVHQKIPFYGCSECQVERGCRQRYRTYEK